MKKFEKAIKSICKNEKRMTKDLMEKMSPYLDYAWNLDGRYV